MMRKISLLLLAITGGLAMVQAYPEYSGVAPFNSAPPYSFGYETSESARQESSDASGKVTGSYRVSNEDGSVRLVSYVADDQGFRAEVETDEAGTSDDQPADVVVRSNAAVSPKRMAAMQERQTLQKEQVKMFSSPFVEQERLQGNMYSTPAAQQERLQGKMYSTPAVQQERLQGMMYPPPAVRQERLQGMMYSPPAVQQERLQGMMYSRPAIQQERLQGKMYSAPAMQQERLQGKMYSSPAAQQGRLQGKMYSSPAVQQERLQGKMYSSPAARQERLQNKMYSSPPAQQERLQSKMHSAPVFQQDRFQSLKSYHAATAAQQDPSAYSFLYNTQLEDGGTHYRLESGDGRGKVVGSYTLSVPDGRYRKVEYVADEGGFRAIVNTNEAGTRAESPADVQLYSSAK